MTTAAMRLAGAPISWGVCEVPGWGYQLAADRVLSEMHDAGLTAAELGRVRRRARRASRAPGLAGPGPLPPNVGDPVVVSRRVPNQPLRQGEDPLQHAKGQRETAAAGAKVRLLQANRVVGLKPHI